MVDILDSDKIEFHYTQQEFIKRLKTCWNGQYTNSQSGMFSQTNAYLNALFNQRFLGINREISEIKKDFIDMKEDLVLDTEILLKERSVTVYDISGISILYGGKVIVTLKNGKKEEVYTRNGSGRELMFVKNKSQINLTRPGIENYYKQNKEKYPGIMELNYCFEKFPTPNYLPSRFTYQDVAQAIYNYLQLTPQKLKKLINEYRKFHKECNYQLCHEMYKYTD